MKKMYEKVVTGNAYEYEKANAHHAVLTQAKTLAKDMPQVETEFISENHCGCCLHYSMALYKLMKEAGIEAYISVTLEENPVTKKLTDNHISVCYVKDGERYIADPVETAKTGKGEYFDIPIEEFAKVNGTIWIYDPYGEYGNELFYDGFLNHPLEIFKG